MIIASFILLPGVVLEMVLLYMDCYCYCYCSKISSVYFVADVAVVMIVTTIMMMMMV